MAQSKVTESKQRFNSASQSKNDATDKRRITVDLDPELHRRFRVQAALEDKRMTDLIREWIQTKTDHEDDDASQLERGTAPRKTADMRRITLDLDPELHRRFRIKAGMEDKRMPGLVREWVDTKTHDAQYLVSQFERGTIPEPTSDATDNPTNKRIRITLDLDIDLYHRLKNEANTEDKRLADLVREWVEVYTDDAYHDPPQFERSAVARKTPDTRRITVDLDPELHGRLKNKAATEQKRLVDLVREWIVLNTDDVQSAPATDQQTHDIVQEESRPNPDLNPELPEEPEDDDMSPD